jgi:hypothetical protein
MRSGKRWASISSSALLAIAVVLLAVLSSSAQAEERHFCYGANVSAGASCGGAYESKNAVYASSANAVCLYALELYNCASGSNNGGYGVYLTDGSQYGKYGTAYVFNWVSASPIKVFGSYWTAPPPPPPTELPPPPPGPDGFWYLRNSNNSGVADLEFTYGGSEMVFVTGDWNGDGIDTPGAYKPSTGQWYLRNSNTPGAADLEFTFGGCCEMQPVVGDWNNDGIDTVGLYKASLGQWFLRNSNTTGSANLEFTYGGGAGTKALAGDWNNDGTDTIGMFKPESSAADKWFLRNSNTTGVANIEITYGSGTEMAPVVGDWNHDGVDSPGLYKENGEWFLRNTNSTGGANVEFIYGGSPKTMPLAGDWNNDGTDSIAITR